MHIGGTAKMKNFKFLASLTAMSLVLSCAPREFTNGEYDDPDQVRLLDDKFNESDAKALIAEMIGSMAEHPVFRDARVPPIVQVETVRNKTEEHIDLKSLTDSLRTNLIKTGRVRFSNKEDRETVAEELDYQQDSGRVRADTKKRRDGSIGADFILTGDLISNTQQVGGRKLIYYRLTLNLTNLTTNLIEWSEEKPIRKKYKKQSISM
jgi:penicillin-binding protein activator